MKLYPVAILLLCSACGQEREQSSATPTPVETVYVTAPQASSVPSPEPSVVPSVQPQAEVSPSPVPSPTETPAPLASPTPTPTPSPLQTSFPANIGLRLKANECGGGCGGYFLLPAFTVDPNTFTADLTPPAAWGAPDSCVDRQESWHIVMDPNNIPNMTFTATWSGTCQMGIHTECTCIYYN